MRQGSGSVWIFSWDKKKILGVGGWRREGCNKGKVSLFGKPKHRQQNHAFLKNTHTHPHPQSGNQGIWHLQKTRIGAKGGGGGRRPFVTLGVGRERVGGVFKRGGKEETPKEKMGLAGWLFVHKEEKSKKDLAPRGLPPCCIGVLAGVDYNLHHPQPAQPRFSLGNDGL